MSDKKHEGIAYVGNGEGGIVEEALPVFRYVIRDGEKILQQAFKQTDYWYPAKGHRTSQRLLWRDIPVEAEE